MKAFAIALLVTAAGGTAHARGGGGCNSRSQIVGRNDCGRFGDGWGTGWLTGVIFEPAYELERFDAPAFDRTDPVVAPDGRTAPERTLLAGARRAMTATVPRAGVRASGSLIEFGGELGIGGGTPPPTVTRVDGIAAPLAGDITLVEYGAYLGVHRRAGRIDAAVQLYAGGRSFLVPVALPAGYHCTPVRACYAADDYAAAVIEPRVRIDVWATRYLTIGVTASYDPINHGESLAIGVAVHPERYDGT